MSQRFTCVIELSSQYASKDIYLFKLQNKLHSCFFYSSVLIPLDIVSQTQGQK